MDWLICWNDWVILTNPTIYEDIQGDLKKWWDKTTSELINLLGHRTGQMHQALSSNNELSAFIRIHGDYHLGKILFTGEDFIIVDFEGEL